MIGFQKGYKIIMIDNNVTTIAKVLAILSPFIRAEILKISTPATNSKPTISVILPPNTLIITTRGTANVIKDKNSDNKVLKWFNLNTLS